MRTDDIHPSHPSSDKSPMEMKTRVRLRRPKPLRLTLTGCEGNHQHIVMLLWAGTFHWIDALQAICSDVYESRSIYIYNSQQLYHEQFNRILPTSGCLTLEALCKSTIRLLTASLLAVSAVKQAGASHRAWNLIHCAQRSSCCFQRVRSRTTEPNSAYRKIRKSNSTPNAPILNVSQSNHLPAPVTPSRFPHGSIHPTEA